MEIIIIIIIIKIINIYLNNTSIFLWTLSKTHSYFNKISKILLII